MSEGAGPARGAGTMARPMQRRSALPILALLLALGLLTAPAAHAAAAFDEVLKDYQSDGKIDACDHSDTTLRDAASQVPANIEQYAPDFPAALEKAIDKRAQGACGGKSATPPPPTTTPPATTTPGGALPPAAAPPPATTSPPPATGPPGATPQGAPSSDSGSGFPLWVIIAGGALLLLGALAVVFARWMGWDGRRLAGARQACGEAAFRAGGTWGDFRDWIRLGR